MPGTQWIAIIASVVVLTSASCSQDGTEPPAAGSTPDATASTPTSSSTTHTAVPAYLEKYTPEEREAYESALEDYAKFSEAQVRIAEVGKATAKARRFYQRYTADWQTYWARLRQWDAAGIRVEGRGRRLWTRPSLIRVDSDGGTIDLLICGTSRGVKVFEGESRVPQPSPKPNVVRVSLVQLSGEDWWRVLLSRIGSPC